MSTAFVVLLLLGVSICALADPPKAPKPGVLAPVAAASAVAGAAAGISADSEGESAGLSAGRADAAYLAAIGGVVDTKAVKLSDFEKWLKEALKVPTLNSCTPLSKDGKALPAKSGRCANGQSCSDAGGVILKGDCDQSSVCCVPAVREVSWNEAKAVASPAPTSSDAGAGAGLGAGTLTNPTATATANYSAPKAFKVGTVPFAPAGTAVYWPLQWNNTADRTYSVICYASDAKTGIQHPATPAAGSAGSCTHSGKKQCYGCSVRKFLALRSKGKRYHSGVDLYAPKGTPIVAAEDGEIVNLYPFFENVCSVIVQTKSGIVINYGEIDCKFEKDIAIGKSVTAGQKIGEVGHLKCCHPMMHFETYIKGTTQNLRSYPGAVSASLLNPTEYLLHALEFGKNVGDAPKLPYNLDYQW